MMKKRLSSSLAEAKRKAKRPPNSNFTHYGAIVYFTPSQSGGLPVHLVFDTFLSKPVPLPIDKSSTEDFILLSEDEILGEVCDNYEEIKSFILDCGKTYEGKITVFMDDLLVLFNCLIGKVPLTVEDVITVLEASCEGGDFSLWNFDLGVGFRIVEEIS